MLITVLGLGEAGMAYAQALAEAGCHVRVFDPVVQTTPHGVDRADGVQRAVDGADLVLSMVGGGAAEDAAGAALPAMMPGAVFADMNTMAPDVKVALAVTAASHDVLFADVAIMAPVPRSGARTPLLVSGSGSQRFAAEFPVSAPIHPVGAVAGTAAELKLLRSVFMKGLAALVFESVSAAEKIDSRQWMISEIAHELGESGEQLVDRLIEGTTKHAARREHEMADAQAHLAHVGSPGWMTRGTVQWLHHIATDHIATDGPGSRAAT